VTAARNRYLAEMGIPVWRLRAAAVADSVARSPAEVAAETLAAGASSGAASGDAASGDAWAALAATVRGCTLCGLHRGRTQTVFGVGKRDARLLVIGEAPGADEDRQGEPFVGRAGQLLNAMLRAIGLPRSEVYIANILKCRPPNNRDPEPSESATCTPYLTQQIELVRPRVLLAVGRIAAQWLLQTDTPIGKLRGRVVSYGARNTPLVVTYHPAYLLRSPLEKAKAWTDLCLVKELLSESP
jgi:uracil-DNA glycosylase family 4